MPEHLSVVLLAIQLQIRYIARYMVRKVVPHNKRDSLPLVNDNPSDESLASHARLRLFLEADLRAAFSVLALLHGHIDLELHIFAMECSDLAARF